MNIDFKETLFRFPRINPYYVICPPVKIHSAGVLVMHRVCHLLNRMGFPAYLVIEREYLGKFGYPQFPQHLSLVTPELTVDIAREHRRQGLVPLIVYPDVIKGHPLQSGVVCRYLLNYPGLLGGAETFADTDLIFSYTKKIANKTSAPDNTLFIPISDPDFFVPSTEPVVRKGRCYYAAKYKHYHKCEVAPAIARFFEITRDRPDSLSKVQLRELFQRSELFYCYENSALAIEAALCGCPVVFMPNEFFTEVIAEYELGLEGFSWGNSDEGIEKARNEISLFRPKYISAVHGIEKSFDKFITITQRVARETQQMDPLNEDLLVHTVGWEEARIFKMMKLMRWLKEKLEHQPAKTILIKTVKFTLRQLGLFQVTKKLFRTIVPINGYKLPSALKVSKRHVKSRKSELELEPHVL